MSIIYRSPLRAFSDNLDNETPYAYYGIVRRISFSNYKADCAQILEEMAKLEEPKVIDNVSHVRATDRTIERFEAFDLSRDEILVFIRMAFVPVEQ